MVDINSLKSTEGKKIWLYRANTLNSDLSSTQYLPETQFNIGINNSTLNVADTDLTEKIPISNGTVNDNGENTLTGSSGGSNSTDNIVVFKPGANVIDNTAQNLIGNGTSATKIWTISNLATDGTIITPTSEIGQWIYIIDQTSLDKFLTSGTCLELKFGSNSSNYYSKTYTAADLTTGWNWLPCGVVNTLTETGTVSGDIDTFIIEIITNNAADTFTAATDTTAEIVYDLLRTWTETDYYKDFVLNYPVIDFTKLESTQRGYLTTIEANGFNLDVVGTVNEDTSKLLGGLSKHTDLSKGINDEVAYVIVDRIL